MYGYTEPSNNEILFFFKSYNVVEHILNTLHGTHNIHLIVSYKYWARHYVMCIHRIQLVGSIFMIYDVNDTWRQVKIWHKKDMDDAFAI